VILDTNALSAWRDGNRALLSIVGRRPPLTLPVVVVGEYLYGLTSSRYRTQATTWLEGMLSGVVQVISIELPTATAYAAVRSDLRAKGKPIPENDMWIAALALQYDEPILSRDAHFDAVDGLRRIAW
jgi:predicted nucleic acid-binding protein